MLSKLLTTVTKFIIKDTCKDYVHVECMKSADDTAACIQEYIHIHNYS